MHALDNRAHRAVLFSGNAIGISCQAQAGKIVEDR
jgi:hypothetical protein